jgi:hypothetical protein
MDEYYAGRAKTIWLTPSAQNSWEEAESLVPPNKSSCCSQFRARIAHLADSGALKSSEHMSSEGEGCFAIKATCGLRAWGWFQHYQGRAAFIISHVVLKKRRLADPADLYKTIEARRQVQENSR